MQSLNEINASHGKLLNTNRKCDDYTDEADTADAKNADGQHDACVSAMLGRQYN